MPSEWTIALARIEELSRQVDDPLLWSTVAAFVKAASSLPSPDDFSLGYWHTSVRLIWPNIETEIFAGSIEIYRFDATGTRISTVPFQPGDALPDEMFWVVDRERGTDRVSGR